MSARSCEYCGDNIALQYGYASYSSARYIARRYCGRPCSDKAKIKPNDRYYKPRVKVRSAEDFHCAVCGKNSGYGRKFCGITCQRKNKILGEGNSNANM